MFSSVALAQAAAGTPAGPSAIENLLPFGLMLVVLYLFIMRPQQKRAKEHTGFVAQLKRGDKVLTSGGIYGEVYGITEKYATLEVADNVRIRILKSQIAGLSKEGNP